MTDDPTVHPGGSAPEEGAHGRDEALAALLAVAPLDEHTRRRLIRRALDEVPASTSGRGRPAWLLGAAAALVVIVVAGVVLLAGGGGAPPSQARRAARPHPAAGPVAPGSAAQVPPRDLGAVGDVTSTARLRQVVDGPAGATGGSLDRIRVACGDVGSVAGVTRLNAVGVGTDGGRPAGIVVGRDTAGDRTAVVVALDRCAPLQRLALD